MLYDKSVLTIESDKYEQLENDLRKTRYILVEDHNLFLQKDDCPNIESLVGEIKSIIRILEIYYKDSKLSGIMTLSDGCKAGFLYVDYNDRAIRVLFMDNETNKMFGENYNF